MKRRQIAAIDVGTSKICTVMADTENGDLRILGVGVVASRGMQKGMVVNLNEAKEAIRESVSMAERTAGYKLKSALIGVTGKHINSKNNRGVISITRNDHLVRQSDLQRAIDIASSITMPQDRKVLHIIPRNYSVDGQEGVSNPVGMHGFRLDVETHIITAASNSIENLTKCIRAAGVEIDDLVFNPLASAEAALTDEEREKGVILADIGGGTTDIAAVKGNSIYHTSVLPIAGSQVTHDISVGLGIPFEMADDIKQRYSSVIPGECNDASFVESGHTFSYPDLCEIVRMRVEELLRLIILELPSDDYSKMVPSGLVITGGTANLPGIAELGSEVLRIPVRVGTPPNLFGVSDILNDPACTNVVGMLLWSINNRDASKSHPANEESAKGGFISRMFGNPKN
ncbi:cell division protein FtsA [Dehalococcoides mccartyi]|uniref:cell division protein FtsA n=1 Tax=Dehalococcoides mccartyi TaxID=61435 RepID=UPI002AFE1D3A|nr:cell division protein FtsA [Dehalococcoides mccartyi]MEA2122188.1 Cell division protein FtsA [Dehalococcoides mccartyi]